MQMRVFLLCSPFCESVIEPIGTILFVGERICASGVEEDGDRPVGKEGCETAR